MYTKALSVFLLAVLQVTGQKREGDNCVDQYTGTVGRCKSADTCESARNDFQLNGIRPTFCTYSAFGVTLVCCRDGVSILHTADPKGSLPIWSSEPNRQAAQDTRRVSERKCEEYSRGVVEKVDFLALLPTPETMSISSAKCDYTGVELIVGGENALRGEFPHMAAIGWPNFNNSYDFKCGGSLISPKYVVTAGHCTRDPRAPAPEPVIVRLGDQNIDPSVDDGASPIEHRSDISAILTSPKYVVTAGHCTRDPRAPAPEPVVRLGDQNIDPSVDNGASPIEVPIKAIHKHPDYKPPSRYNDIALFELASEVTFEAAIRPACLWTRPDFGGYTKAMATGWGVTDTATRTTAKELQKVSLSLLDNEYCDQLLITNRNRNWLNGFAPTQMCAGELRGGKDTCQGDSGSPLQVAQKDNQCIFHIVGLTSFGRKCAETGRPAVYTRISSFLPWIESVVWPDE